MRSLLFVPADSPRKLEKSLETGADALIVDLEDSVAVAQKDTARNAACDFIKTARKNPNRPRIILRVNALDSSHGFETTRLSFIVNRPGTEPGFRLVRQEVGGRQIQYSIESYAAQAPEGQRYK